MAFSLVPDVVLHDIFEIKGEVLAQQGITLLLADLDNTLIPYGKDDPTPALQAWKDSLHASGVALFILSNSRKSHRVPQFAAQLGVPFLARAGKPKLGGFHRAMAEMGRTADQTAMVGDQMFTDILGAKRAGIPVIAVRPVAFGNPFRAFRYAIELPARAMAKGGVL